MDIPAVMIILKEVKALHSDSITFTEVHDEIFLIEHSMKPVNEVLSTSIKCIMRDNMKPSNKVSKKRLQKQI